MAIQDRLIIEGLDCPTYGFNMDRSYHCEASQSPGHAERLAMNQDDGIGNYVQSVPQFTTRIHQDHHGGPQQTTAKAIQS